jgi:hypothetical protein
MTDAPDTHASSTITNHAFVPETDWWTRCARCGLSEAAHAASEGTPALASTYTCPECVTARDFGKPMLHQEGTCPRVP